MQDIIESEFSSQTVIAVMHRLRFVERFDKVLLMEDGEMVEFESPAKLLQREESRFRKLYLALKAGEVEKA